VDAETIVELFQEFGPVSVRRMFGGAGVFVDGRMIGLVARDVIYLKADAETIPAFQQEGLVPFGYATNAWIGGYQPDLSLRSRPVVHLMALYAFDRLRGFAVSALERKPRLTRRECEVLTWIRER
jgi:TfoX/Sxy family transcriptional regulator of competence genes